MTKTYASAQTATLEIAGDAKLQYAANGGKMTLRVAAKIVGATAMTAISVAIAEIFKIYTKFIGS